MAEAWERVGSGRPVLLVPVGSWGDVNPLLWMGSVIAARGHPVTVLANGLYADAVGGRGLRFVEVGKAEDHDRIVRSRLLWSPAVGTPFVLRIAAEASGLLFRAIEHEVLRSGELPLLIAPGLAFAARMAREKHGVPLLSAYLQPAALLSAHDFQPPGNLYAMLSPAMRARLLAVGGAALDLLLRRGVGRAARGAGMPAPRRPFRDWWRSPDGGLALFPEWFAATQADWPRSVHRIGFPLFDQSDRLGLAPELERFLAVGEPPVLFTAGSAMATGGRFFRAAAGACARLGCRAIFATKFPGQLPAELPAGIHVAGYSPFGLLLPRCAAIIHHGGIGTTSQAFAAGTPQLIMPMAHDQPDNALRVRRLGVGDSLSCGRFKERSLATVLGRLMADSEVRRNCALVRARLAGENPAERLVDVLAPWLETAPVG